MQVGQIVNVKRGASLYVQSRGRWEHATWTERALSGKLVRTVAPLASGHRGALAVVHVDGIGELGVVAEHVEGSST